MTDHIKIKPYHYFIFIILAVLIAGIILKLSKDSTSELSEKTESLDESTAPSPQPAPAKRKKPELTNLHASPVLVINKTSDIELLFDEWKQSLSASLYPEDQLWAYLLSRTKEKKELHLLQAYGLDPADLLINYEVMRYCSESPGSSLCNLPYMDLLQTHEAGNANFNLELAQQALKQGDKVEAINHIKLAGESNRSDDYNWRYFEMIDNSMRRFGVPITYRSWEEKVGYMAAQTGYFYPDVSNLCNPSDKTPMSVTQTCGNAFKIISEKSSNYILKLISYKYSLQAQGFGQNEISEALEQYRKSIVPTQENLIDTLEILQAKLVEEFKGNSENFYEELRKSNFDVHIPDILWSNYLELNKTRGMDAATYWLTTQLIDYE